MAKLCVCLETVFTDLPLEQRIARVARIGYKHVEFWLADNGKDIDAIAEACRRHKVKVNDFVVNPPTGEVGGTLVDPKDRRKYLARLADTIAIAKKLRCRKLITCTGNDTGASPRTQCKSIIDTLRAAAPICEEAGVMLVVEPLNTVVDHAGYFLDSSVIGAELIRAIDHPNIRLLYDCYHMQIMEGNILDTIGIELDVIGHFHSASVPGRHEVFLGELNYPAIVKWIYKQGYTGCFGLEYKPTMASATSLRRTLRHLS